MTIYSLLASFPICLVYFLDYVIGIIYRELLDNLLIVLDSKEKVCYGRLTDLNDNFSLIRIVNILKLMIWIIQVNSFWYLNVLCTQYWKEVFKGRELEYIKCNITSNIEWFVSPYYLILEIEGSLNSYCSGLFIYQAYNNRLQLL